MGPVSCIKARHWINWICLGCVYRYHAASDTSWIYNATIVQSRRTLHLIHQYSGQQNYYTSGANLRPHCEGCDQWTLHRMSKCSNSKAQSGKKCKQNWTLLLSLLDWTYIDFKPHFAISFYPFDFLIQGTYFRVGLVIFDEKCMQN